MTYTVAIVDEGLLGLTNFRTPKLHDHFFKREALGITTWDLFDDVVGAYGGELERLLALGGGSAADIGQEAKRRRFPPVVTFLGPFQLPARGSNEHQFEIPQYVGAVRVMVVAGSNDAYGSTDKSVYVRKPLMLLPTLPRVIGPTEDLKVPVSTFVMDPSIKDVTLTIEVDDHFEVIGAETTTLAFETLERSRLRNTSKSSDRHCVTRLTTDFDTPVPLRTSANVASMSRVDIPCTYIRAISSSSFSVRLTYASRIFERKPVDVSRICGTWTVTAPSPVRTRCDSYPLRRPFSFVVSGAFS